MKKAIYCYNIDDVDQHILETITAPMNIELGLLDDGMLKMTVEEILQRQPASNQDCTRFDISFMLMDELSDEEMKQILSAGEQAHWHFDPIILFFNFLPFQTGQTSELHIQNCFRLNFAQAEVFHQTVHRNGSILGTADQANDRVNVIQRNLQAFQDMRTILRFLQFKACPAHRNVDLVIEIAL